MKCDAVDPIQTFFQPADKETLGRDLQMCPSTVCLNYVMDRDPAGSTYRTITALMQVGISAVGGDDG